MLRKIKADKGIEIELYRKENRKREIWKAAINHMKRDVEQE